ncbi:hypothetical protein JD76_00904 [Micromonospora endolithica]|nr:hypothetical protein JD76_00904 [Micromonospora endolithica]
MAARGPADAGARLRVGRRRGRTGQPARGPPQLQPGGHRRPRRARRRPPGGTRGTPLPRPPRRPIHCPATGPRAPRRPAPGDARPALAAPDRDAAPPPPCRCPTAGPAPTDRPTRPVTSGHRHRPDQQRQPHHRRSPTRRRIDIRRSSRHPRTARHQRTAHRCRATCHRWTARHRRTAGHRRAGSRRADGWRRAGRVDPFRVSTPSRRLRRAGTIARGERAHRTHGLARGPHHRVATARRRDGHRPAAPDPRGRRRAAATARSGDVDLRRTAGTGSAAGRPAPAGTHPASTSGGRRARAAGAPGSRTTAPAAVGGPGAPRHPAAGRGAGETRGSTSRRADPAYLRGRSDAADLVTAAATGARVGVEARTVAAAGGSLPRTGRTADGGLDRDRCRSAAVRAPAARR